MTLIHQRISDDACRIRARLPKGWQMKKRFKRPIWDFFTNSGHKLTLSFSVSQDSWRVEPQEPLREYARLMAIVKRCQSQVRGSGR